MIETILRLSRAILGFRREDAYTAVQATAPAAREAVDGALDSLVERGELRREGPRFYAGGQS